MNNVLNEQLSTLLEEIELIGDNYQRADIRVKLISALSNLCLETVDQPTGKDALKHDNKKEVEPVKETTKKQNKKKSTKSEKEDKKVEIESDDTPIIFDPVEKVEETEEVVQAEDTVVEDTTVNEDPQPIEVELEPQAKAEVEGPIIIDCEDEEGNTYQLDITEAWNVVGDEEGSEERVELARNLTEYNLLPVYNTLEKLDHSYNKMMLSYYMQEYGLEGINEFIESLTEGMFADVYEFVNNENLEGLIANIEEAATEE